MGKKAGARLAKRLGPNVTTVAGLNRSRPTGLAGKLPPRGRPTGLPLRMQAAGLPRPGSIPGTAAAKVRATKTNSAISGLRVGAPGRGNRSRALSGKSTASKVKNWVSGNKLKAGFGAAALGVYGASRSTGRSTDKTRYANTKGIYGF